jgi:hypothetical protein
LGKQSPAIISGRNARRGTTFRTGNVMMTQVKSIRVKGNAALVEFVLSGKLQRKFIPASEIVNGAVADDVLNQGILYGYPWEDINITFDSERFADELHNVGVWTIEDALKSPLKVWAALNATLADGITAILQTASYEKKRGNHGK